jgi:aldehyde dehydrogenase (NAD+)
MTTTITSTNPFRPTEVVAEREAVPVESVPALVHMGRAGYKLWSRASAATRAAALGSAADEVAERREELARLVTAEVGKPITEARGEVDRTVAIMRYYAQLALLPDGDTLPPSTNDGALLFSRRVPLGVVLVIAPWNFPLAIPAWKSIPALAYGNSVILKPATPAVATATALEQILNRHLPPGAFQAAAGGAALAEALVDHPDIAAVTFTGSTHVGRAVAVRASQAGKPAQCEMGGQNASIVLADADLTAAANVIAHAAMGYSGQKCTATSRVIVERAVLADFRGLLVESINALRVGDPADETTTVGPVISDQALAEVLDAIEGSSGRILTGGSRLPGCAGHVVEPTLVELADTQDRLAREEVFGPVAALVAVDSAQQAIKVANELPFGLSAAVFTRNLTAALTAVQELESGLVRVNASTAGVDFHAPFGGVKGSSAGPREQGLAAREFFTETRTVLINPSHG